MDEHTELVDVELTPAPSDDRGGRLLALLGGTVLVAALLLGAYLATNDDAVEVDLAVGQDDVTEVSESDGDQTDVPDEEPVSEDRDLPADEGTTATTIGPCCEDEAMFAAEDSAYYGGEPGGVIYDGEQFLSIGYGPNGQTLRTSVDGVEWNERAFPGLPENAHVYRLAEHDGTLVAVVEQWQEFEEIEDSVERFFGPSEGPKQFLASTDDLETWTLTELPAATDDDGPVFRSISGLALNDAGVVLLTQTDFHGEDELRILFEAGIIDEVGLDTYCGLNFSDSEAIIVQRCNHEAEESFWMEFEEAMSAAETDEEREAIEREFEENYVESEPEVIATIEPGDPIYDRLSSMYEGPGQMPANTVLSGPVEGPWVESTLPANGYAGNLVETDGTFVAVVHHWGESNDAGPATVVLRSTNGSDWSVAESIPGGGNGQLAVAGSNLVLLGGDEFGETRSFVSSDAGATWTPGTLSTALFGTYPQAVSGPAGIAVVMRGSIEPYPDFGEPEAITVTKDDFTLTMTFTRTGGTVTLTGPDGAEIYSLSQEEMYDGSGDEIVRLGRLSGSQTFLDPETGEDLVTFTNSDFERAYEEIMPTEPGEEIAQGLEIMFSNDGQSWRQLTDPRLDIDLRQGDVQVVAVGADEVIVAVSTWNEPPMELFAFEQEGREPSQEEERALDEWFEENHGGNATKFVTIAVG